MNNIVAIVQARMSSTRLPGKVLKDLHGKPMLAQQLARIKRSNKLDNIIVATSNEASDQAIIDYCQQQNISCFAGSLADVLDRFYQAAIKFQATTIVRLTADCPLIDSQIIDLAIEQHDQQKNDYTTNSILPDDPKNTLTYADGLDVEVIEFDVLEKLLQHTKDAYYREHVTSYIRSHTEQFTIGYLHHSPDISAFRLTVDYPEDFTLIEHIFHYFNENNLSFSYMDVIDYLAKHPEIYAINQHRLGS